MTGEEIPEHPERDKTPGIKWWVNIRFWVMQWWWDYYLWECRALWHWCLLTLDPREAVTVDFLTRPLEENGWAELLNEILDLRWLYCRLSHCIEFTFGWRMSNWNLNSACWLKVDIEHWNLWTTRWLPWFLTTCPIWIWIADNLNRKLAFLIPDWKLRLHDEDETPCLFDILEQMDEIFDVLMLRVDERAWELFDRILKVISELNHPKKFSNSWPELWWMTLSRWAFWSSGRVWSLSPVVVTLLVTSKILSNSSMNFWENSIVMLPFLSLLIVLLRNLTGFSKVRKWTCLSVSSSRIIEMNSLTIWSPPEMTKSSTYATTASRTWPNWSFLRSVSLTSSEPSLCWPWSEESELAAWRVLGASLRPYSWRLRRQTIGSE